MFMVDRYVLNILNGSIMKDIFPTRIDGTTRFLIFSIISSYEANLFNYITELSCSSEAVVSSLVFLNGFMSMTPLEQFVK